MKETRAALLETLNKVKAEVKKLKLAIVELQEENKKLTLAEPLPVDYDLRLARALIILCGMSTVPVGYKSWDECLADDGRYDEKNRVKR